MNAQPHQYPQISHERFRDHLERYLLPMFPGSGLGKTLTSDAKHGLSSYSGPCKILVKPFSKATFRVPIVRSQPFASEEKKLVEHFVERASEIFSVEEDSFIDGLMTSVPRWAIAALLAPSARRSTLEGCLQRLEELAGRTYEGRPVVAAFGITKSVNHGPITQTELFSDDFSAALATGPDALFLCGSDGRVFNVQQLKEASPQPRSPLRFGAIAAWTLTKKRVALLLNRTGEILVFANGAMMFAKRRGGWRFYPHEAILKRLGLGLPAKLRAAVYESCLDVSFSRTGGCIAVLTRANQGNAENIVDRDDLLEFKAKARTKLLAKAVTKSFSSLDRRLRRELLAIDGAMILNHSGSVLAVGAIVKVPQGSSGGGRRAAAIQLSKHGIGVKISADGPITGFRKKQEVFAL